MQAIEDIKSTQAHLNVYHKQTGLLNQPYRNLHGLTIKNIQDVPRKVFISDLSLADKDEDVYWVLDHEWCHAEALIGAKNISVSHAYDPKEILKTGLDVITLPDIEEAICYSNQLKQVRNGDFDPSIPTLKGVLKTYTKIYDGVLATYADNSIESIIVRQLVTALINPHNYKLPRK